MIASKTPQEAINEGLARPSECDIVIVIFWSRMGTPLAESEIKPDAYRYPTGTGWDDWRYLSGTEWEYIDGMQAIERAGEPVVIVYRRTEKVLLDPSDTDFSKKLEQWQHVEAFFKSFSNSDGSIRRSYNPYNTPDDFREQFEHHMREVIGRLLDSPTPRHTTSTVKTPSLWKDSPFPGLRAFRPEDAPIYFGRGRETDALIKRLSDNEHRFLAVIGASGSGKSSLVGAGLIPRLMDNAIPGSKDWRWLRFTPGEVSDNPFSALSVQLTSLLERTPRDIAEQLVSNSEDIVAIVAQALDEQPDWARLLLFIDQFEELFTVVHPDYRAPFIDLLHTAAHTDRLRTIATMRADFYHRCVEHPRLAELLRTGSFPLAAPEQYALYEMIARPAARAGLTFEDNLAWRILDNTGTEPGALALMAYTLDELYQACRRDDSGLLSHARYEELGGVQGAIGTRAEHVFMALDTEAQATLPHVFRELVEVDERGTATRQRAPLARFETNDAAWRLLREFTDARLLTTSGGDNEAVIEVAHEALFRSWERLATWIETAQDDLRLLRQVRQAAREWDDNDRAPAFLWPDERLKLVYAMQDRLQPDLDTITHDFICPEADRLLAELEDIDTTHARRSAIGERLCAIGDPRPGVGLREDGLPDIEWCYVDVPEHLRGKKIEFIGDEGKYGDFEVKPFYMAKYPITFVQFQAFLDAPDGFERDEWWQGLHEKGFKQEMNKQRFKFVNHPRETVNWYQSVAFCRWLTAKLPLEAWPDTDFLNVPIAPRGGLGRLLGRSQDAASWEIRLPAEWEWQYAATGGDPANKYLWGSDWENGRRCNTIESGLNRTTAVGMYPHGVAVCGALDMSGNVYEWCLNEYGNPENTGLTGDAQRVLRGGAFDSNQDYARCGYRYRYNPLDRDDSLGFRVVVASPISKGFSDH